ncbi:T9SS type A sorting domain-containing protein [Hymenobacter actinosclerus]|uniref:Por secretion system C-terminal sorting domain-containing protein n=1 Tax=Hymenobacter actinosclerus TaxID=82805 RepID=A0A1I0EE48_9BACT|nr:T9SS type A sorting domain-containing protein [Hymenobacter actinosclerus]SET43520.1 Por secretion system C-terminal sorting domain-containing protein [Hymenobacter actinosclerus]
MTKNLLLLTLAGTILIIPGRAQTVPAATNAVTEIITDYNGYWRSGNGSAGNAALSPIRPENSHNLLAFKLGVNIFSTRVNNTKLDQAGISYVKSEYKALPVLNIAGDITGNTKVGLGQLYDRVNNGPSVPAPSRDLSPYLRDGLNGLDIGTGIANVPTGAIDFGIDNVKVSSLGDGNPDIVVTQIASPGGKQDIYQFLDANDQIVGNSVAINVSNLPVVGKWIADFYEASTNPMTLGSGFTNTEREIRLWAGDFAAFGITSANVTSIRKFRLSINGDSDLAFVAYNTEAAELKNPLPVTLTSFGGQAKASYSDLRWETAQELNAAAFEVQASADGRTFAVVGRVEAAGSSGTVRRYTYRHSTTQAGPRYYRLRQLDLDGSSSYSSVVTLMAPGVGGAARVTAAPNPFGNSLKLLLSSTDVAPATVQIQLCTLAGRMVYEHTSEHPGGSGELELTGLAGLPAGFYLARVVMDGQATVLKVVKQ